MRVFTAEAVLAAVTPERCRRLMAELFSSLAGAEVRQPLRQAMPLKDGRNLLGMMPCQLDEEFFGIKVTSVFPENSRTRFDSHQGAVLLFSARTGELLLSADASEITRLRTAAVSALATDRLSRADSRVLAVLGSGVQAHAHVEALRLVRPFGEVRIFARDEGRGRAFADEVRGEYFGTVREAVRGADVICTTTAAVEPLLFAGDVAAGTHINAVGACRPNHREVDGALVRGAAVIVDYYASAVAEAGDILLAGATISAELSDLPTRRSSGEITLFKSVGFAAEDIAVATFLYREALRGTAEAQ